MSLIASYAVDTFGRKPLLKVSLFGTALTLLVNTIYFYVKNTGDIDMQRYDSIPFFALLSSVIIFSVGMDTIPMLIKGEIFPTNLKAFATCFYDISFTGVNALISKYFFLTESKYGIQFPFLLFTICSFIGTLFIIYYIPETKGKTLEQIQEELGEEKRNGFF